jgi:hypothetical protein
MLLDGLTEFENDWVVIEKFLSVLRECFEGFWTMKLFAERFGN